MNNGFITDEELKCKVIIEESCCVTEIKYRKTDSEALNKMNERVKEAKANHNTRKITTYIDGVEEVIFEKDIK